MATKFRYSKKNMRGTLLKYSDDLSIKLLNFFSTFYTKPKKNMMGTLLKFSGDLGIKFSTFYKKHKKTCGAHF